MIKMDRNALQGLKFSDPTVFLATWFGVGLMKPAPGTWGTIAGVPFAIIIVMALGWSWLLAATIVLFFIGVMVSDSFEYKTNSHDSSCIVIDEVVGIWLTISSLGLISVIKHLNCFGPPDFHFTRSIDPFYILLAVILFRFFDILKPWPISYMDRRIPGGLGVMVDDVVAGIFAAACLIGFYYAVHS